MENQGNTGTDKKKKGNRNWRKRKPSKPTDKLANDTKQKSAGAGNSKAKSNDNEIKPRRNNQQQNQGKKFDRPRLNNQTHFGFTALKNLSTMTNKNDVIKAVADKENQFQNLISHEMNPDVLVLAVNVLSKICHADFVEVITRILSQICSDNFLKTLENYLSKLPLESGAEKMKNMIYHEDRNRFWENLNDLFKKILELIPHTACNKLLSILQKTNMIFKNLETNQDYKIDEKIKNTSLNILKDLETELKRVEKNNAKIPLVCNKEIIETKEQQPPQNFRLLNVVPRLDDLRDENPFFRPCKVKDAYVDIEHYLDIQFRLLREDFLMPLRDGFNEYVNEHQRYRNSDFRIYRNVKLMPIESSENNIGNKLFFGKSISAARLSSKRFMFGNLLLLSRDNFRSIIVATISGSDKKYIVKGYVLIEPCAGSRITPDMYNANYVVLESKIFFEPYYQVLNAMKNIRHHNFPMEGYLIRAETDIKVPAYLEHQPLLKYKDFYLPVAPDQPWPSAKQLKMDESQLNAFKSALTQEFALVQGPPGTGKTFLASQIVRVLLENEENWRKYGPIVIVCLTNHALDQFLEYILRYTNSVVRIGNRSKSEILQDYTLMKRREALHIKSRGGAMMFEAKEEIEKILSDIRKYRLFKNCLTTPNVIVPLDCLFNEFPSKQFKSDEELVYWLTGLAINDKITPSSRVGLNNLGVVDPETEIAVPNDEHDDDEEDYNLHTDNDITFRPAQMNRYYSLKVTYPLEMIDNEIRFLREEIQKQARNPFNFLPLNELWTLENELEQALQRRNRLQRELNGHPVLHDRNRVRTNDRRWQAYWNWVDSTTRFIDNQVVRLEERCRNTKTQLEECKQLANLEILRRHKIIGLTTTCAARMQASLRALSAPIVLVEEAAEILEAHIICSITSDCQHLILIGDHKQLKPKASVYELGVKYNLNVSLFERMVNIRGECSQLAHQHRMRPEISKLITPSIYKTLYNHEVVRDYPNVKGLEKNVFFINHDKHEQLFNNEDSWKNPHEVKFFLAFAKHLLLQNYKPSDITILCTYTGQLLSFMNEIGHHAYIKDIRVTTVDNFQGEENKIILLSLVRNNGKGNVGFLREENRVCVALSRAKEGLYIMGNMNDLVVKNNIWPKIKAVLDEDEAIGDTLKLRCQMHPDEIIEIKSADDFKQCPEGGCSKKCDALLPCGHKCTSICHVLDQKHEHFLCKDKCVKSCPNNHPCPQKCFETCRPCQVMVEHDLPCGHTVSVHCHVRPDLIECPVKVNVTLPDCNHDIEKKCYEPIEKCICTHDCEIRVPCGHACAGKCHLRTDPDHLSYICFKDCTKNNIDCENNHICKKRCFEKCGPCAVIVAKPRSCGHYYRNVQCSVKIEEINCKKKCNRTMSCGHKCKLNCSDECKDCPEKVEKTSSCGHTVTVKCCEEPLPSKCNGKCPKTLPCGHPCTNKCRDPCTIACKVMVTLTNQAFCGHVFEVPCYMKNSDPQSAEILKYCKEPCKVQLGCDHVCKGNCGSCLQGRMHIPCQEPCRTIFICGHKCETLCNKECLPCVKPCKLKCCHSKCYKKCGLSCTACKELCNYGCKHRKCSKRCYELCDVEPCNEACEQLLKCGHPCVGFCGEPCPPLCRICNKEELTEILFGDEDEKDARFVFLPDCRHCIESNGLMQWINTSDNSIQMRCCPKCKTPINSCMRVMNKIKQDLANIMEVKKKVFFQNQNNLGEQRKKYLATASETLTDPVMEEFPELKNVLKQVFVQGKEIYQKGNYQKKQILSYYEINAFKNILDVLFEIVSTVKLLEIRSTPKVNQNYHLNSGQTNFPQTLRQRLQNLYQIKLHQQITPKPITQYNTSEFIKKQVKLLTDSVPTILQISKQRLEDIQLELRRLQLMTKLQSMFGKPDFLKLNGEEFHVLMTKVASAQKFTEDMESKIIKNSEELKRLNEKNLLIERQMIVKAIGLSSGHYYKCPNGHVYVIGDCGGANQRGKCPDCGAVIGGMQHRLAPGNTLASEFGATTPAWPM